LPTLIEEILDAKFKTVRNEGIKSITKKMMQYFKKSINFGRFYSNLLFLKSLKK